MQVKTRLMPGGLATLIALLALSVTALFLKKSSMMDDRKIKTRHLVEAAHTGFSVVAEEVGKLASSSAESTQEISQLVQEAMEQDRHAVANLNKIAESNAAASEEIAATVIELSKIADGTRQEVDKFQV